MLLNHIISDSKRSDVPSEKAMPQTTPYFTTEEVLLDTNTIGLQLAKDTLQRQVPSFNALSSKNSEGRESL